MKFLETLKLHDIYDLIKAKNRDEMRGVIEAENDLMAILSTIESFDRLVDFMKNQFVQDAEIVLFGRLLRTKDKEEEVRIISQLNYTKKLQKQFLDYVKDPESKTYSSKGHSGKTRKTKRN